VTQHAGLTAERWACFAHPQRVLMIANEMNRAGRLMGDGDAASRRLAYERILRLADLTIAVAERRAVRRELLRWRDLVAALYLETEARPDDHRMAFRALLQQTPESALQINALGC
jgi:hypothetical protein